MRGWGGVGRLPCTERWRDNGPASAPGLDGVTLTFNPRLRYSRDFAGSLAQLYLMQWTHTLFVLGRGSDFVVFLKLFMFLFFGSNSPLSKSAVFSVIARAIVMLTFSVVQTVDRQTGGTLSQTI